MKKGSWQDEFRPSDERDDPDEWDDEEEERDPNLDPGFSSWSDFYNYMYG